MRRMMAIVAFLFVALFGAVLVYGYWQSLVKGSLTITLYDRACETTDCLSISVEI